MLCNSKCEGPGLDTYQGWQYHGCSPVLQRILRNKHQLLQSVPRSVACSQFHKESCKTGSKHDIADSFGWDINPEAL